jgi:hypothetical protein
MQYTKECIIDGEALGGCEAAAFFFSLLKAAASQPHSKAPFGANKSMRFINPGLIVSVAKAAGTAALHAALQFRDPGLWG